MENKDYKLIDQYLRGELDEKGVKEVHTKRQLDAEFEAELSFQEETKQFLQHKEKRTKLREQLQQLSKENKPKQEETKVVPFKRRNLYILGIAASIALVLFFAYPFLFPSNLYDQFADHQALSLQTRNDNQANIQAAENAFNIKDFATAYDHLKSIVDSDTIPNAYHQIALGIAALETNRLEEAQNIFSELAEGDSAFIQQAQWYQALTYVKGEDFAKAKPLLETIIEEPWKSKAQALLGKL